MKGELIPFGKYKGQPAEQLLGDSQYLEWLLAQPWFKQRYGNLYTVVINYYGQQVAETPDHNSMQVRFLKEDWRLKFLNAAIPLRVKKWLDTDSYTRYLRQEIYNREQEDRTKASEDQRTYDKAVQNYGIEWANRNYSYHFTDERKFFEVRRYVKEKLSPIIEDPATTLFDLSKPNFEKDGIDISFSAWPTFPRLTTPSHTVFNIEIKPTMADDFPEVLRQMKRTNAHHLLLRSYTGEGATVQEMTEFFAASNISVIFEHKIEQAAVPPWGDSKPIVDLISDLVRHFLPPVQGT